MKNVTIITGPPNTGKTTRAKEMVKGRKAVWLPVCFDFSEITPETEVIVLDGCTSKNKELLKYYITCKQLHSEDPGCRPILIDRPELIIISNDLKRQDLGGRYWLTFIEMEEFKFSDNDSTQLIGELLPRVASKENECIWSILHRLTELVVKQHQEIENLKNLNRLPVHFPVPNF